VRFALGCGNFGGIGSAPEFFGAGESRDEAFGLMDAAWELGIRHFDTADAYGGGASERWIGAWMRERGTRPFLTTKVFHSVEGDPGDRGLAPERVRRQLDGSLERLGVERVDLYLAHEPDAATPLEETVAAFEELQRGGRIGAFGLSNAGADELERALAAARVACVQNSFSLLERADEADVLPLCERHAVGYAAFSPLAGGVLTGKYRAGAPPPEGSRLATRPGPYAALATPATLAAVDAFCTAAADRGADAATLALAWILADDRVTTIVVGPRRPEHLQPARRALELELTPAERDGLTALFAAG
jgi:aryl-alcohol dehydrogenase-like predicted oxidoreductase